MQGRGLRMRDGRVNVSEEQGCVNLVLFRERSFSTGISLEIMDITLTARASITAGKTPIPSRGGCQVATAVINIPKVSCRKLFRIASIIISYNRRNS